MKFSIINKKAGVSLLAAISLAFFVFAGLPLLNTGAVKADAAKSPAAKSPAVNGLNKSASQAYTGKKSDHPDPSDVITDIPSAIGKIVGALLSFIGVVFLILMIYGGLTWMLARGNEQEVGKAKNLIFAAIIGLIIVLSAYAITSYVGVNLLG